MKRNRLWSNGCVGYLMIPVVCCVTSSVISTSKNAKSAIAGCGKHPLNRTTIAGKLSLVCHHYKPRSAISMSENQGMSRLLTTSTVYGWLCCLFLLLAFSAGTRADTLSASVDRDTISLQETFTLTLRFYAQTSDSPDLTLLQKDFDVLSTQQSNQMRVINGSMESFTDWRIALAPKRVGTLEIPAFTIEGARSDPISITVESQSRAPQNASSNVFVDVEVSKNNVYVQEQILFTIRLFTSVSLNGAEMSPLELPDALVLDLVENQYQTNINGRQHVVVVSVYSIFPQHSGELVIPSLTYNVSVRTGQRDPWSDPFGNRRSTALRLRTDEQTIKVNSVPPQFSGQDWLPAKNLQLTEHWSSE